jgi:hypothetical protein
MSTSNNDIELEAIQQVLTALEALDAEARERVIDYVFKRLGLKGSRQASPPAASPLVSPIVADVSSETGGDAVQGSVIDIRALKDSKAPKTDNEMAALVAYYLKHHAQGDEKKDAVSTADLEKYFVQAGYPLPKQPRFTLQNAKNAGYFDSAGRGLFKLNPVGHNLVAHGLHAGRAESRGKTSRAPNRKPKKQNARKK